MIDVIWGWLRRLSWSHPCWLLWCVCVTGTTQAGLLWHLWHLWHLGALHRASHLLCRWHSVMEPRAAWGRLGVGMTKVGFDPRRSQVLVSSQLSTLAWCSPSPHHVDSMPGGSDGVGMFVCASYSIPTWPPGTPVWREGARRWTGPRRWSSQGYSACRLAWCCFPERRLLANR